MILKKPYGFIIKHFKLINLLLLIPTFYVTLCFSDISKFLRKYVNNKYSTFETGIPGKYITLWLLISLVFLILFNIMLYSLMKKKNKSTKLYTFSIIYYFILFVLSLLLYNAFTSIEIGTISTTTVGIYKDIMGFIPFIGYFLIVITLFNSVGFNIKTLRFDQSLNLQLTDEDTEEFEIGGKEDQASLKKIFIHSYREMKYYIVENKFIVSCIAILFLLILSSNIYINIGVYNKKYATNENLALNNMLISVKESYITNVDQGGNIITENKYFLVLKIGIENVSNESRKIEFKNFRIDINNKSIFPSFDRGNRFLDIAKNYDGNQILPKKIDAYDNQKIYCKEGYKLKNEMCSNKKEKIDPEIEHNYYCPEGYELKGEICEQPSENSEYNIVYEISKSQIKESYEMKILNKMTNDIGELNPSYKIIKFKPVNLLNKENLGIVEIGNEIDLKETNLGETKLKINGIKLLPSYRYSYDSCTNNNCIEKQDVITAPYGKTLVIVEDEVEYDKSTSFYKNTKKELYKYFGRIDFKYKDKEYSELMKDVTPSHLTNKRIYQVSSIVKNSTNKKLVLTIRNKFIELDFE